MGYYKEQSSNRTIVELKLRKYREIFAASCSSNRTIVELKLEQCKGLQGQRFASNRTIVELKQTVIASPANTVAF